MVAVVYYAAARVGMLMEFAQTQASPVWPPSGIALAALLLLGHRIWPAVAVGAFLANLSFSYLHQPVAPPLMPSTFVEFALDHPSEILKAALIALGNTLEAAAGAWLLARLGAERNPFTKARHVALFVLAAAAAGAVGATWGVTTVCAAGVPWSLFGTTWLTWWLGDIAGVLAFVPLILTWAERPVRLSGPEILERTLAFTAFAGLALMIFHEPWRISFLQTQAYLLLPPLLLLVFRYGLRETSLAVLLVAGVAVSGTVRHQGPFAMPDENASLVALAGFVAVLSVTGAALSATLAERRAAQTALLGLASSLDRQVKARTEDLARSNAELEQFAYVASHDLQEPARMVGSYTQILREELAGRLTDQELKYMGYTVDGARRMQAMVRGLLEYARAGKEGSLREEVDLASILADAIENLKLPIEESGAVITVGPLPRLRGNRQLLTLVFQNLLSNAVKFREAGRPPRVEVTAFREGPAWVVRVRDDGIGIDPLQADRLFALFQRLHSRSRYDGVGLGLALVKKIAERHGGRVWTAPPPERGTDFFVSLPADA